MSYTTIKTAYHPFGLYIGGLGETILNQKLCNCTDSEKIALFNKSDILKKNNIIGVCFPKLKCRNCISNFENICSFNKRNHNVLKPLLERFNRVDF
jgi:hypothetical protein